MSRGKQITTERLWWVQTFETFLNEPRRYSEEQTRRIMQVAFATREVKNCMEKIEREIARAEEKMLDTAINEEADEEENEEE